MNLNDGAARWAVGLEVAGRGSERLLGDMQSRLDRLIFSFCFIPPCATLPCTRYRPKQLLLFRVRRSFAPSGGFDHKRKSVWPSHIRSRNRSTMDSSSIASTT